MQSVTRPVACAVRNMNEVVFSESVLIQRRILATRSLRLGVKSKNPCRDI